MTGYGAARGSYEGCELTVEVWSLNHRHFDFSFHGPEGLASLEVLLRKQVAQAVGRGRVRMSLKFLGGAEPGTRLVLSLARAEEYVRYGRELATRYELAGQVSVESLLLAPQVVVPAAGMTDQDAVTRNVSGLVAEALAAMDGMQVTEGRALAEDLGGRLGTLATLTGRIREEVPAMMDGFRRTLESSVKSWNIEPSIPAERLSAEILLFAERSDVTEELVRLESHLAQSRDTLAQGGAVGHRLDFLAQELSREINTIGAKSQSGQIADLVVRFKEELAKVREQLQNVV
jgi:uncharacterized protein (TIGR00255 family)